MQVGQHGRKATDRVVRELRVGNVTLDATHGQHCAQRTAATDAHDIAERLPARWFTQDAPVDVLVTVLQGFDDFERAVARTTLFVARDQHRKTAAMIRVLVNEALERDDHGGEPAFHIGRSAPIQVAVAFDRFERIRVPFLQWPGRHDVRMAGKTQHGAGIAAAGPQIRDLAKRHRFALEAHGRQTRRQDLLAACVVGRDGWSPNQIVQQAYGWMHRIHRGVIMSPFATIR